MEIAEIKDNISSLETNISTKLQDGLSGLATKFDETVGAIKTEIQDNSIKQTAKIDMLKEQLEEKIVNTQTETVSYVNQKINELSNNNHFISTGGDSSALVLQGEGLLALPAPSGSGEAKLPTKTKEVMEEVIIEEEIIVLSDPLLNKIDTISTTEVVEEKIEFHIPMGMARGTVISGVNAPILNFGNSSDITSNPVYISLDSEIMLANNHTIKAEECMLLGAAAGQLTDSRGTIILNKISCILTNHKTGKTYRAEDRIEGWVFGEDGLVGLKGRLITREGDIIATALPLTLLETAMTYITEKARSSVQVVGTNDVGFGGYISSGAKYGGTEVLTKLADIYIKYLDALNPVVSILPGREVTVAFRGTTTPIVLQEYEGLDVAYFDGIQHGGGVMKINDRSLYE